MNRMKQRSTYSCLLKIGSLLLLGYLSGCGLFSEDPNRIVNKAEELLESNRVYESILESKKALQINPKLAKARWTLGEAYLKLNNGSSALKELKAAKDLGFSNSDMDIDILEAAFLSGKYASLHVLKPEVNSLSHQSPSYRR